MPGFMNSGLYRSSIHMETNGFLYDVQLVGV